MVYLGEPACWNGASVQDHTAPHGKQLPGTATSLSEFSITKHFTEEDRKQVRGSEGDGLPLGSERENSDNG